MSAGKGREQDLWEGATPEQKEVIQSSGSICVQACPGSGKTWTATRMFVNRVNYRQHKDRGVAFLSFTRTAVKVFAEKIAEIDSAILLESPNFIGTFDSFVDKFIISPFFYLFQGLEKRPIYGDWDDKFWCADMKRDVRFCDVRCRWEGRDFRFEVKNGYSWKVVNSDECEQKIRSFIIQKGKYTHSLRRFLAIKILENEKLASCLANRFEEIIVDEAQDLQPCAFHILDIIHKNAERGNKISLIGDIQQSIYRFSGVLTDVYERYIVEWGVKKMSLSYTRRCSRTVVEAINGIFGTDMVSNSGSDGIGAFFVVEGSCDRETVTKSLGIHEESMIALRKSRTDIDIPHNISRLMDVCIERDKQRNPCRAYKALKEIISEYSKTSLSENDPIPDIWEIVRNRQKFPGLECNLGDWLRTVKSSFQDLSKRLNLQMSLAWVRRPNGQDEEEVLGDLVNKSGWRTIHSSKGETYRVVMVSGSLRFWNSVVTALSDNKMTEECRLLYVAMTRAKDAVVLVLPKEHMRNHGGFWDGIIKPLVPMPVMEQEPSGQMHFAF